MNVTPLTEDETRLIEDEVRRYAPSHRSLARLWEAYNDTKTELEGLKQSLVLEADGTPEDGGPADVARFFDEAVSWTLQQLAAVLGVKEYSTSGGGTETLDGDVRGEIHDILKAAKLDDDSREAEQKRAVTLLENYREFATRYLQYVEHRSVPQTMRQLETTARLLVADADPKEVANVKE